MHRGYINQEIHNVACKNQKQEIYRVYSEDNDIWIQMQINKNNKNEVHRLSRCFMYPETRNYLLTLIDHCWWIIYCFWTSGYIKHPLNLCTQLLCFLLTRFVYHHPLCLLYLFFVFNFYKHHCQLPDLFSPNAFLSRIDLYILCI